MSEPTIYPECEFESEMILYPNGEYVEKLTDQHGAMIYVQMTREELHARAMRDLAITLPDPDLTIVQCRCLS
jgi:hypothetical protein